MMFKRKINTRQCFALMIVAIIISFVRIFLSNPVREVKILLGIGNVPKVVQSP